MAGSENGQRPMNLAQALAHPMRVSILMKMNTPRRCMSPSEYAYESGELLGTVSYHFRSLRNAELIELVKERPVRGATEHFYEPTKRAMAWARTLAKMPPAVIQNLAAVALGGAVESIGNAIDSGTFTAREESHLSYDATVVDFTGWLRLIQIFDNALIEAMAVEEEVNERLRADPDIPTFVASFLMSCWEAAPDNPPASS